MAKKKQLWARTAEDWHPGRLAAPEAAALTAAAERSVEASTFGEFRRGVRVQSRRLGRRTLGERLAGAPQSMTQYLFIYARHLVILNRDGEKPPYAIAKQLHDIEVRRFESPLVTDHGVTMRTNVGSELQQGDMFLGLGEGPVALAFEQTLREATSRL